MHFIQRWWPFLPALGGFAIVMNEALVHRDHLNGTALGAGLSIMSAAAITARTNGKH